ncbi:MAG: hypothetical protein LUD12_08445 [Lachnospiraceae bacterium]|nr:hypothetical protein [Lachnospiraceae bacterium]
MTMTKAIFDGKVYPSEQVVSDNPEYREASKKSDQMIRKLEKDLDKSEYGMVEAVLDEQAIMSDCQNLEFFKCGLAIGMALREESEEMLKRLYGVGSNCGKAMEENPV